MNKAIVLFLIPLLLAVKETTDMSHCLSNKKGYVLLQLKLQQEGRFSQIEPINTCMKMHLYKCIFRMYLESSFVYSLMTRPCIFYAMCLLCNVWSMACSHDITMLLCFHTVGWTDRLTFQSLCCWDSRETCQGAWQTFCMHTIIQ